MFSEPCESVQRISQGLHHQVSPSAPNVSVTTGGVTGLEDKELKATRTTGTAGTYL